MGIGSQNRIRAYRTGRNNAGITMAMRDLDQNAWRSTVCAVALVSLARGVPVGAILAPNRAKARVAMARQIAMYLVHVALRFSLTETGRCFGRDRTTAAHACTRVEAHRDDPDFDLELVCLEAAIFNTGAPGAPALGVGAATMPANHS
jgi:DnaA-like protein